MMDQTVYMPGYSSGPYRPPQGSKLATYMNRGGPQQGHNLQDINNKMTNLSMMNRPPAPGSSFPAQAPTYNRSSVSGYSTGSTGRLSPSMRNLPGLGNGNLGTPPPLRTPNSVSTPTSAEP